MPAAPTMTRLPPNYVHIAKAITLRGAFNVMGVVVDVWGGAYKSKGTSTCITFTIKDENLDNGHAWDGLKIKYFRDSETLLPPVRERDVVLLRGIHVRLLDTPFGCMLGLTGVCCRSR